MKDSYIPSYVYYGVDNNPALAMRMLGIPRSLSLSLSQIITGSISDYSFTKLRNIINSLSLNDWDSLKPTRSKIVWRRMEVYCKYSNEINEAGTSVRLHPYT